MPTHESSATWEGDLQSGSGKMMVNKEGEAEKFSFASRFGDSEGASPEELIGAAHAGCFSMAFAGLLGKAGYHPARISTTGRVGLEENQDGFSIASVTLVCEAAVPGISEAEFLRIASEAKDNCPVSKALQGTEILLDVRLL